MFRYIINVPAQGDAVLLGPEELQALAYLYESV